MAGSVSSLIDTLTPFRSAGNAPCTARACMREDFYQRVFALQLGEHELGPLHMAWFPMKKGRPAQPAAWRRAMGMHCRVRDPWSTSQPLMWKQRWSA
jgi:hypothetical protein